MRSLCLWRLLVFAAAAAALLPAAQSDSQHPAQHPWTDNRMFSSLHDLQALDIDGKPLGFKAATEGKAVLVANVASHCGFTANHYLGFKALKEKFKDDLVIIAFPCNQFGNQEADPNHVIKRFADDQGFKGLLMDKVNVNGIGLQHPVFKFLKEGSRDVSPIQWNFAKFLLGKDGTVIGRFPHTLDPLELTSKIESIVSDTL